MTTPTDDTAPASPVLPWPNGWKGGETYFDPAAHIKPIKRERDGKVVATYDYLNVQDRLLWFIRDQRALIVAGLGLVTYIVRTEMVEHEPQRQWAHFRTYVRDVLGNEATMYGQATYRKNVPDYCETASTRSLGRALLCLGYGTAAADEFRDDLTDTLADTPVERRERQGQQGGRRDQQGRERDRAQRTTTQGQQGGQQAHQAIVQSTRDRIINGCRTLGRPVPADLPRWDEPRAQVYLAELLAAAQARKGGQAPALAATAR